MPVESFFPAVTPADPLDESDVTPPELDPVWGGPPHGELPVPTATSVVVGRSASTVVSLDAVRCWSTGLTLDLSIHLVEAGRGARRALFHALDAHHGRGPLDLFLPAGGLRLGVQYADGRRTSTVEESAWLSVPQDVAPADWLPDQVVLEGLDRPRAWGRTWRRTLWMWPVPPPGDVTVVCLWPDRGIEETRSSFPAGPVIAACAGAGPLWPDGEEHG
ncbi:hypothetical protein GB931_01760 [Modestobacter sp. I12A-02628]|uniref:Uncharacterized protein n=1 Tax=Goekera deserti TaxID=2497753 RepID=A0A7K3WIF4_9ACTN|nr:hypothetical protein [Goekera deserti]MPQ96664.1 hypothetical protein [Goekera deserti]NDI47025.1 hypothetical protein [Goekera deserti]NEL56261.1 hypothetical protein [Goekera deserti]